MNRIIIAALVGLVVCGPVWAGEREENEALAKEMGYAKGRIATNIGILSAVVKHCSKDTKTGVFFHDFANVMLEKYTVISGSLEGISRGVEERRYGSKIAQRFAQLRTEAMVGSYRFSDLEFSKKNPAENVLVCSNCKNQITSGGWDLEPLVNKYLAALKKLDPAEYKNAGATIRALMQALVKLKKERRI